jgi:tripartite-type tricarboxylate transporter receptor subunit TctC
MSGGGGLIAASYIALRAKSDGATFGEVSAGISASVEGLLDVGFDPRAFQFVGALASDAHVCLFSKASGITTLEKWATASRPPRLGMTGPGAASVLSALTLASALQLPIQPVMGYAGTAQIRLAIESGEVDGTCVNWDSAKVTWTPRDRFAVVVQTGTPPIPELPDVPLAIEHAKSEMDRAILAGPFRLLTNLSRCYALPPGTSPQDLRVLRAAFTATMSDPGFIADARNAGLEIRPLTGETVAHDVGTLFEISPPLLASFRAPLQARHRSAARPAS